MNVLTPGPWQFEEDLTHRFDYAIVSYVGGPSRCVTIGACDGEADARLITAAPSLLAAAKAATEAHHNHFDHACGVPTDYPPCLANDRLLAAIRKAEGKPTAYGDGEADQSALTGGHFEVRE